jgi:hypothetical protein
VPVDLAWFTRTLTIDELEALCATGRGWTSTSNAAALCTTVTEEIAVRKHAAAARERTRHEAAWAAAQYAADAKRGMRTRTAGKRRRCSIGAAGNRRRGGGAEQAGAPRPLQQVPD